jgi:hypothetical protein
MRESDETMLEIIKKYMMDLNQRLSESLATHVHTDATERPDNRRFDVHEKRTSKQGRVTAIFTDSFVSICASSAVNQSKFLIY